MSVQCLTFHLAWCSSHCINFVTNNGRTRVLLQGAIELTQGPCALPGHKLKPAGDLFYICTLKVLQYLSL